MRHQRGSEDGHFHFALKLRLHLVHRLVDLLDEFGVVLRFADGEFGGHHHNGFGTLFIKDVAVLFVVLVVGTEAFEFLKHRGGEKERVGHDHISGHGVVDELIVN